MADTVTTECFELFGCSRRHFAKGLCQPHYTQRYRGQELRPLGQGRAKASCSAPCGCDRTAAAQGLCFAHLRQSQADKPLTPIRVARDVCARDHDGRKQCCSCELWLSVEDFHFSKNASDGLASKCKICSTAYYIERTYGISAEKYSTMRVEQDGKCAICRCVPEPTERGVELVVDHDHRCCPGTKSCGACVRRLLCPACNTGLGFFRDDPERLEMAAAYLRVESVV